MAELSDFQKIMVKGRCVVSAVSCNILRCIVKSIGPDDLCTVHVFK